VAFKIRQNAFPAGLAQPRTPLRGAHDAPIDPVVGWILLHALHSPLKLGVFGASIWRGRLAPNIFL